MSSASRTKVTVDRNGKAKKYPHMGFRPPVELLTRINRLASTTGVTVSEIINACLANHMPILERKIKRAAETLGRSA